jgi:Tol biopolymer transport system component
MKRILAVGALVVAALLPAQASDASGNDGYLVVNDANTGQIYRLTQLGTGLTQLTNIGTDQLALAPRWSPDGQRIAFVIFDRSTFLDRMYTMARDGSDVHPLRDESAAWNNDVPDYFPHGKRIAFARCKVDGGGCVIATVHADGSHLHALTQNEFEKYDFYPDVSPDGSRIAFVRLNANGVHGQVWIMNADGTDAHAVTPPALEATIPRWTPDGAALIVSSNCCRLGGNIYRVPATGGRLIPLTHTKWPNFSSAAAVAPSGRRIAFSTDRNYPDRCCADLYLMHADGGHQVKISTGLTGVQIVDWGPGSPG